MTDATGQYDARADLRAAVRRLTAAISQPAVEVVVQRVDLQILMACIVAKFQETSTARVAAPDLHPGQV